MTDLRTRDWSAKRPIFIGVIGTVLLLGGFGTWAATAQISGAVIAQGRIEVDQNRQVVQHLDGGIVQSIEVDEGAVVDAGDVLLRLDPTKLKSQLTKTESQLFELMARRGRLEAERDANDTISFDPFLMRMAQSNETALMLLAGQQRLLTARRASEEQEIEQLQKRKAQIADQISGISAQQAALQAEIKIAAKEPSEQEALLADGLAQASRVANLQRELARLEGSLGDFTSRKAQAEGRITEFDIELLKLTADKKEEAIATLRDIQYRELELREERAALIEQLARLDIVAPVGGIVYGLTVNAPRSVLRAADPVLYVVPQDRPLVIQAKVDPINVDQLYPGQEVTLRFSALDQRTTPELTGQVAHISADAFEDQATQASYFQAEITLSEQERARLPEDIDLIPGMPVEAFIQTTDRTPIGYFTKPLTDYFVRAFKE